MCEIPEQFKRIRNLDFCEFSYLNKKLYVVEDHPTVLLCWYKAHKEKLIEKNSTLFHIDQHADFCFKESNKEKSNRLLELSDEELIDFIRNDLDTDNAEFIVNSMCSSLIGDAISIHKSIGDYYGEKIRGQRATTDHIKFTSEDNKNHKFYYEETEDLRYVGGDRGLFGCRYHHQDTNKLFQESKNLILDIDLDFFTYSYESTFPRHRDDIIRQIESDTFTELIDKSKIITIALEPRCCGGIEYSLEILSYLNEVMFQPIGFEVMDKVQNTFIK